MMIWLKIAEEINTGKYDDEFDSFKESCIIGLKDNKDFESKKAVERFTPKPKAEKKKKI